MEDFNQRAGYGPSLREIAEGVGLSSTSSVAYQVKVLKDKGYLRRTARRRSRVSVLRVSASDHAGPGTIPVQLVGRIKAGEPTLADEDLQEVMHLPKQLIGEGDFIMLTVAGNSMINAAIAHGDMVVIRRETDVLNGDIVAAMLPSDVSADGEATIKTFRKIEGHVWLMPQNPDYPPIPGDKAKIIGKVVSVLRRL
jgi:repressor LexA